MLKNAPTLAIVAVHTAENEPLKISLFHFISSILSLPSSEVRGLQAKEYRDNRNQRAELQLSLAIQELRSPYRTDWDVQPHRHA